MLEAIQEHKVTAVGKTFELDAPFIVLATQNPVEQEGTYPLPEAQLDRFMFLVELDYPSQAEEVQIARTTTGDDLPELRALLNAAEIIGHQQLARRIPVPDHTQLTIIAGIVWAPGPRTMAAETPTDRLDRLIASMDENQDRRVSRDEFLKARAAADIAKRHFRLCDRDSDGGLDRDEFRTLPTLFQPRDRGPLPDPIGSLFDNAVIAMDKSFNDWNTEPSRKVEARRFVSLCISTFGSNLAPPEPSEADTDGNG